ncbi:MAG TPA: RimK/LysX family protein [Candidatus Saccharimonadales bacterium]|nr:RimK/LysX family protein [Candidatus Saccharimonadales bacterium]
MKQQKLDIIGSIEIVHFPELGIMNVPVKIDTGADASSLWASSVQVTPEGLRFMLFAPGSHLYTGKEILAEDFRIISIKNSFGQSEFRYKVKLLVRIGDRRIRGWFSLSERENMKYPVLLGRRLLKNKFLVDVSKIRVHSPQDGRRVLMLGLGTPRLYQLAQDLTAQLADHTTVQAIGMRDLKFLVETNNCAVTLPDGSDLADFDLIYFKCHRRLYPLAIAAARYATFQRIPFFDRELATHVSYDKLSESMRLATHGLLVVPSLSADLPSLQQRVDEAAKKWGWPLVCKEINEDRGRKNYLLQSSADLEAVLKSSTEDDTYVLQPYIQNDGYIRLLVLGSDVAVGVHRTPALHDEPLKAHLNNPRGSSNATKLKQADLPHAAVELAVQSAALMGRQVAGVDLIQDMRTKAWYILEVNASPELIAGAFPAEKRRALAKFIDFELNR